MEKGWLHDPSVILSSAVLYEVIYLGCVNARGSGDKMDAQRALTGEFFPFKKFPFLLPFFFFLFLLKKACAENVTTPR